ncbi:dishevelled-like protein [Daphnia pulex]|uniref:Dishevelled-like protein n=1 Tax=Daphnia pulex TaxID=6669 RepID=E9GM23_DAPPU|nr:dishevelled-like protein [Daphnia pulex]|eukprot:EFX79289.1 dishevelled-like protein [Daphnia pulex]
MAETKIIYHIDEEETPYLVKLTISPDQVTLADFKNVLNRPNYKFFFKSMDDDFGVVKEEIVDDDAHLPCFNGRVISWLVSAESSISDSVSQCAESTATTDGRPPSFHPGHNRSMAEEYTTATETESVISSRHSGKLYFLMLYFYRGTYCPALAVCIVKLMKNMIALMIVASLNFHVECLVLLCIRLTSDCFFSSSSSKWPQRYETQSWTRICPIKLVVAKCWDPNPKGYFTIPRTEPVRPIDPGAWVAHTEAARGDCRILNNKLASNNKSNVILGGTQYPNRPPSVATMSSTTTTMMSSMPETERPVEEAQPLSVRSDMLAIVRAMARPDSGLEVRDRLWLKIVIPSAFIGSEVVDWLHNRVQGLEERRDARKLASQLLRNGYIRHTVNKYTFSEQCYYVFGDLCLGVSALRLTDDTTSEADRDTLAPLPLPTPWGSGPGATGAGGATPHIPYYPTGYAPMPYSYSSDPLGSAPVQSTTFTYGREGSVHSGSGSSGSDVRSGLMGGDRSQPPSLLGAVNPVGPGIHGSSSSSGSSTGSSDGDSQIAVNVRSNGGQGGADRPLNQVPDDMSGSRQSFRMAMTNPCQMNEYFVDVM